MEQHGTGKKLNEQANLFRLKLDHLNRCGCASLEEYGISGWLCQAVFNLTLLALLYTGHGYHRHGGIVITKGRIDHVVAPLLLPYLIHVQRHILLHFLPIYFM